MRCPLSAMRAEGSAGSGCRTSTARSESCRASSPGVRTAAARGVRAVDARRDPDARAQTGGPKCSQLLPHRDPERSGRARRVQRPRQVDRDVVLGVRHVIDDRWPNAMLNRAGCDLLEEQLRVRALQDERERLRRRPSGLRVGELRGDPEIARRGARHSTRAGSTLVRARRRDTRCRPPVGPAAGSCSPSYPSPFGNENSPRPTIVGVSPNSCAPVNFSVDCAVSASVFVAAVRTA